MPTYEELKSLPFANLSRKEQKTVIKLSTAEKAIENKFKFISQLDVRIEKAIARQKSLADEKEKALAEATAMKSSLEEMKKSLEV